VQIEAVRNEDLEKVEDLPIGLIETDRQNMPLQTTLDPERA
jgi:hypothetical protein